MPNPRDLIQAEIAALRARLANLERADELLRPYYPDAEAQTNHKQTPILISRELARELAPIPSIEPESNELEGRTILEAAQRVLKDARGEFLNAREVAERAMRRGYRSTSFRNREGDPKKIVNSFYAIMKRNNHIFDTKGSMFGLMEDDEDTNEDDQPRMFL